MVHFPVAIADQERERQLRKIIAAPGKDVDANVRFRPFVRVIAFVAAGQVMLEGMMTVRLSETALYLALANRSPAMAENVQALCEEAAQRVKARK